MHTLPVSVNSIKVNSQHYSQAHQPEDFSKQEYQKGHKKQGKAKFCEGDENVEFSDEEITSTYFPESSQGTMGGGGGALGVKTKLGIEQRSGPGKSREHLGKF